MPKLTIRANMRPHLLLLKSSVDSQCVFYYIKFLFIIVYLGTCFSYESICLHCVNSVTSKKSPNDYKSCPKRSSLEMILIPLQKLPKNVGNLGKIVVATGFEKLPKVQ